jgi:nucleotidyltransferase substrate binding protein (TIGR01987 family)
VVETLTDGIAGAQTRKCGTGFEYTVESVWKCLQLYLLQREGIECYSPKSCLREAKNAGLLDEGETVRALEMIDDRNLTAHTYHEEIADAIYRKLPAYAALMETLINGMTK